MKHGKNAFTLMELLVVITIIAILAAILMPSLARARDSARSVTCLSNAKQMGSYVMITASENKDLLPAAYTYRDYDATSGSGNGYVHWSAIVTGRETPGLGTDADATIEKNIHFKSDVFKCPSFNPSDPSAGTEGGWRPSTAMDYQAEAMAYAPNAIFMPRRKCTANEPFSNLVRLGSAAAPDTEILIAEYSDRAERVMGNSNLGGKMLKSHRPTNGLGGPGGLKWKGGEADHDGDDFTMLKYDDVIADSKNLPVTGDDLDYHIFYTGWDRHNGRANYTFADGHASSYTLKETLDPKNYLWGQKVYAAGGRDIKKP